MRRHVEQKAARIGWILPLRELVIATGRQDQQRPADRARSHEPMGFHEQMVEPPHVGDLQHAAGRSIASSTQPVVVSQGGGARFLQQKVLAARKQRHRVSHVIAGTAAEHHGLDIVGRGQLLVRKPLDARPELVRHLGRTLKCRARDRDEFRPFLPGDVLRVHESDLAHPGDRNSHAPISAHAIDCS